MITKETTERPNFRRWRPRPPSREQLRLAAAGRRPRVCWDPGHLWCKAYRSDVALCRECAWAQWRPGMPLPAAEEGGDANS